MERKQQLDRQRNRNVKKNCGNHILSTRKHTTFSMIWCTNTHKNYKTNSISFYPSKHFPTFPFPSNQFFDSFLHLFTLAIFASFAEYILTSIIIFFCCEWIYSNGMTQITDRKTKCKKHRVINSNFLLFCIEFSTYEQHIKKISHSKMNIIIHTLSLS